MPLGTQEFRTPTQAVTVDLGEPGAHLPTDCHSCAWAWVGGANGSKVMRLKVWSPICIAHCDVPVTDWPAVAWAWEGERTSPRLLTRKDALVLT